MGFAATVVHLHIHRCLVGLNISLLAQDRCASPRPDRTSITTVPALPAIEPVSARRSRDLLPRAAGWTTTLIAVTIVDDLSGNISALALQAGTGLLAIFVLLVVMNWFFHKVYWTGWISMHNKRKRELLDGANDHEQSKIRVLWGLGVLGFTSLYREGFEVVLFLQSYRLRLGGRSVFYGVVVGILLTVIVAVLTFVAHRKLPYKKMLVLTGVMLGAVLLVMVGEQAQEMQLAHWLPAHPIASLASVIPAWAGLWFSIFPTVETLGAQAIAGVLVIGSYLAARK